MLRRDQIDIVHLADILQLDVPLCKLFGRDVEAILLMGDVVILAEHAAWIASAGEDTSTSMMTL
jgi:hypothetical protein